MTEPAPAERSRTGVLWGILAVFLVLGAVGLATVVYGAELWSVNPLLSSGTVVAGAVGAFLAFLFMAGILYRVDRYRGATQRRVNLFE